MNFGKYAFGLLVLTMGTSVYGKTFIEYKNEARTKTPSCEISRQFLIKPFITTESDPPDKKHLEFMKLENMCQSELRAKLPPEALALEQMELKKDQEKLKNTFEKELKTGVTTEQELNEEGWNIDGTIRKPSWYEPQYWKFKKYMSKRLEAFGSFLLWPIGIISVLLGLFLITNPKGFTEMVFGIMSGIARLLIGKKTHKKD